MNPAAGKKTPSGVAVFSYKNNRVTVSEAGVPAMLSTTAAKEIAEVERKKRAEKKASAKTFPTVSTTLTQEPVTETEQSAPGTYTN